MARMIDADKLIENFRNAEDSEVSVWTLEGIIDEIENTVYDTEHEEEMKL